MHIRSMFKKVFEPEIFFSTIFVPLIALALYCGSFAYFSSRFQLEGVNYYFASRLGKYVSLIMAGTILALFVMLQTNKGGKLAFKYSNEKFHSSDLLFLLLPLTPVVQYILNNQEILSPADSLYVLMTFTFFSGLYIFAIPTLLRAVMSTRTLMILGLAFVFTIANMSAMSNYFSWFEVGSLKTQLMLFGGVFLVARLLYHYDKRWVLYLFIVVNFAVNSSVQLCAQGGKVDSSHLRIEENKLLLLVGKRTPSIKPNIYLLVYDAYVPNETMLAYGIDNSAQEDFLSEQGFKLYPHTYSIGSATIQTMSRVLNASTEYYGDKRRGVSGDGVIQKILDDLSYKTYGLFYSDFMFRGYGDSYDYSTPEKKSILPPYVQLLKAIFLGEFRFNIENVGFVKHTKNKFAETKQSIFEDISGGKQIFIYMHSNLPSHSQNSGACLANEIELYKERVAKANIEMRQDINLIIANDPGAIVIVAGDHGPYLTRNCDTTTGSYDISEISRLDIQDRHATFLAIRWPTGDFVKYDDITVLQDLFPAIFAYLFKDPTILESKINPIIPIPNSISGASVNNGLIIGGINDGEPLFLSGK